MLRNATLLMQAPDAQAEAQLFQWVCCALDYGHFLLCYYNPDLENQLITDTQATSSIICHNIDLLVLSTRQHRHDKCIQRTGHPRPKLSYGSPGER